MTVRSCGNLGVFQIVKEGTVLGLQHAQAYSGLSFDSKKMLSLPLVTVSPFSLASLYFPGPSTSDTR